MRLLNPRTLLRAGFVLLAALAFGASSCDRCEQNEQLMEGECVRTCNSARECTGEEECVDGICRAASGAGDAGMTGGSSSGATGSSQGVSSASASSSASRGSSMAGSSTGGASSAGSMGSSTGASSAAASSSAGSTGSSTSGTVSSSTSGLVLVSSSSVAASSSVMVSSSAAQPSSSSPGSSLAGPGSSSSTAPSSSRATAQSSSAPMSSSAPLVFNPSFPDLQNAPLDSLVTSLPTVVGGAAVSCSVSSPDTAQVRLCLDSSCFQVLADWSTSVSSAQQFLYVQVRLQTGTAGLVTQVAGISCNGGMSTWSVTTTPAYVTFVSSQGLLADAPSYTFTDQALGPPMAGRILVVAVHTATNVSTTINGVTVGTTSLFKIASVAENVGAGAPTAMFAGLVPGGSTGNIQVNVTGIPVRCGIGVHAVYGVLPTSTPRVVEYEGANPTTINLGVAANGVMVTAMTMNQSPGGQAQWTSLTETYDYVMMEGTNTLASGAAGDHLAAGTLSVDVSAMSGGSTLRVLAATWP